MGRRRTSSFLGTMFGSSNRQRQRSRSIEQQSENRLQEWKELFVFEKSLFQADLAKNTNSVAFSTLEDDFVGLSLQKSASSASQSSVKTQRSLSIDSGTSLTGNELSVDQEHYFEEKPEKRSDSAPESSRTNRIGVQMPKEQPLQDNFAPSVTFSSFVTSRWLNADDILDDIDIFVNSLRQDMTPEESGRQLHVFIEHIRHVVEDHPFWANMTNTDLSEHIEIAQEAVEMFVVTRIYARVFSASRFDEETDADLSTKMQQLSQNVCDRLNIDEKMLCDPRATAAIRVLREINTKRSPLGKIECIQKASTLLHAVLAAQQDGDAVTSADEFLPLFIATAIVAMPVRIHSNVRLIQAFRHPGRLQGVEGYLLSHLRAVISFVNREAETGGDVSDVFSFRVDELNSSDFVYAINTRTSHWMYDRGELSVQRSLHDLVWLRGVLQAEFAGAILPPLPTRSMSHRLARFMTKEFLVRVAKHPEIQDSHTLKFALEVPEGEFARAKKAYEKDSMGKMIHSVSIPPIDAQIAATNNAQRSCVNMYRRAMALVEMRVDALAAQEKLGRVIGSIPLFVAKDAALDVLALLAAPIASTVAQDDGTGSFSTAALRAAMCAEMYGTLRENVIFERKLRRALAIQEDNVRSRVSQLDSRARSGKISMDECRESVAREHEHLETFREYVNEVHGKLGPERKRFSNTMASEVKEMLRGLVRHQLALARERRQIWSDFRDEIKRKLP